MDISLDFQSRFEGSLHVPSSKSYGQRALAASLLLNKTKIKGLGNSDDELAALKIIEACNPSFISKLDHEILIHNSFNFNSNIDINCGESALCARLFSSLFILNTGLTKISGTGSLNQRPMQALKSIYEQLGIIYMWNDGKLPISFSGAPVEKNLVIDGSLSSQFISGILYYLVGLKSSKKLCINIENPQSIPYILLTIDVLSKLGAKITQDHQNQFTIHPSLLNSEVEIEVEKDWSSASFWAIAAAINGKIELKGLNLNSKQADIKWLDVLKEFGSKIIESDHIISIESNLNKSFSFDATHCPDLIPILSVLAVFAEGESKIYGVNRLIHKESNRLEAIITLLSKIGVEVDQIGNFIKIKGNRNFNLNSNLEFDTFQDHRIAMSMSILASKLNKTKLNGVQSINKSYPDFYKDYALLGGKIVEQIN